MRVPTTRPPTPSSSQTVILGRIAQAGDFLILWDQQGGSTDLFLRIWSGTAPNLTLGAPVALDDAGVSEAAYGSGGFRGEAAVNLTDTIFGGVPRSASRSRTRSRAR